MYSLTKAVLLHIFGVNRWLLEAIGHVYRREGPGTPRIRLSPFWFEAKYC